MCNWCSNRFVVHGDKGQLLRFYMDMTKAISAHPDFTPVDNSWKQQWVGNLFLQAGYSENEVRNSDEINCRGDVIEIGLEKDYVYIDDETAWGPNDGSMQKMLDEKYPGLEMVFRCEEPGMGVFVNTDETGRFLPERYIVDIYSENDDITSDYDYARTATDVMEMLARAAGVPAEEIIAHVAKEGKPVELIDWNEWLEKRGIDTSEGNVYISINKFELN